MRHRLSIESRRKRRLTFHDWRMGGAPFEAYKSWQLDWEPIRFQPEPLYVIVANHFADWVIGTPKLLKQARRVRVPQWKNRLMRRKIQEAYGLRYDGPSDG